MQMAGQKNIVMTLKIVFSVLFFTTMFRNSYFDHRYSIRLTWFALFLMILDSRVHALGGARGQDPGLLIFYFIIIIEE